MKIAQVAPLYESVPPKTYGGTERVVSYLTEELVGLGHDVTLYAAGDSITSARLVSPCEKSLRLDERCIDPIAHHFVLLDMIARDYVDYDIVHFHIDYLHFPVSRCWGFPQLTTLHGRLDLPDLPALYQRYREMPVVSISDAQRKPLPEAGWVGTVMHGLPLDLLRLEARPEGYLAFLGRISPEKRVDRAIEIAKRAGMPLRIAAKIDKVDQRYFEQHIAPLLDHPLIEFIGELADTEKSEFLGKARALLFPIDWPEPFGLVMIEAMACGTPVLAYPHGSVSEVIDDGVTGFHVASIDQAVKALERVDSLSRRHIRQVFERRFSARRMANDYLELYHGVPLLLSSRPRTTAA